MRLEPISNPIDEKAGEVAGLLSGWTADAVGGRNLARGGTQEPRTHTLPATSYYKDLGEDVPLEVGQTYTFSVIIDKVSDDTHPIQIHLGLGNGRRFSRDMIPARNDNIPFGKRFSITFTPTEQEMEGEDRDHFAWRIRNQQQETTVSHRELKLERGPVATPWTPAPEDAAQALLEGETPTSPFPPQDPALTIHTDNSVGNRIFVGDTMIYGDTGTLEIDKDVIESGRILLSRQGPFVHVHFDQVIFNNAPGSVHLSRIPISYRPVGDTRFPLYAIGALSPAGSVNIPSSGYFNVYGTDVDKALSGQATYRTRHTWPISLHAPTVSS